MYSDERKASVGAAKVMNLFTKFPGLPSIAPWACHKALPVQAVTTAILRVLEQQSEVKTSSPSQTIYEIEDIEKFSR